MKVKEAAVILGVSEARVRQRLASGVLRGKMESGEWVIDSVSVEANRILLVEKAEKLAKRKVKKERARNVNTEQNEGNPESGELGKDTAERKSGGFRGWLGRPWRV